MTQKSVSIRGVTIMAYALYDEVRFEIYNLDFSLGKEYNVSLTKLQFFGL